MGSCFEGSRFESGCQLCAEVSSLPPLPLLSRKKKPKKKKKKKIRVKGCCVPIFDKLLIRLIKVSIRSLKITKKFEKYQSYSKIEMNFLCVYFSMILSSD